MIFRKKRTWAAAAAALAFVAMWKTSFGAPPKSETLTCEAMHVFAGHPGVAQLTNGELKAYCSGDRAQIRTFVLSPHANPVHAGIVKKIRPGQSLDLEVTDGRLIGGFALTAKASRERAWPERYGKTRANEVFETVVNGRLDTKTTVATRLPVISEDLISLARPLPNQP